MINLKEISTTQLIEELRSRAETKVVLNNTGPEDRWIINYSKDIHTIIPVGSILLCVSPGKQPD